MIQIKTILIITLLSDHYHTVDRWVEMVYHVAGPISVLLSYPTARLVIILLLNQLCVNLTVSWVSWEAEKYRVVSNKLLLLDPNRSDKRAIIQSYSGWHLDFVNKVMGWTASLIKIQKLVWDCNVKVFYFLSMFLCVIWVVMLFLFFYYPSVLMKSCDLHISINAWIGISVSVHNVGIILVFWNPSDNFFISMIFLWRVFTL